MYILVMGSDLAGRAPSLAPLLWAWEKGLGSFHSCSRCCTELMEGLPGSLLPPAAFSVLQQKPPFHSPLKTHLIVPARIALKCHSHPVSRSSQPQLQLGRACTRVCEPGRAWEHTCARLGFTCRSWR